MDLRAGNTILGGMLRPTLPCGSSVSSLLRASGFHGLQRVGASPVHDRVEQVLLAHQREGRRSWIDRELSARVGEAARGRALDRADAPQLLGRRAPLGADRDAAPGAEA